MISIHPPILQLPPRENDLRVSVERDPPFMGSQSRKPPTFSVRLDFLKCVQIFLSYKAQICTVCLDLLYRFALLIKKSRHVFCTYLRFGGKENVDTLEKI